MGAVILEIISVAGLMASLVMASVLAFFFRYFQRYFEEPEEFRRSYNLVLLFLVALILHSLHLIGTALDIPNEHVFEVMAVFLLLGVIFQATRRAFTMAVTADIRREEKARRIAELTALQKELEKTAKELSETKDFFNSIIESSADAIVASDNDKRIIYFSRGAEELFERKAEEVLGKNVLHLYPKDALVKEKRLERSRKLRKKGVIRNIAMEIETPSGKRKNISLSLSLLRDEKGRVRGTVGVAKDVTREVKAAEEVRYLKELSDRVFEGIPEGLILMDNEFGIISVNRGFERITGVRREDVIGKNALEYMRIPELEGVFEAMHLKQKVVMVKYSGQSLGPTEFTYVSPEGERKVFTDYWTPLFDEDGEVEHILVIIRDMTKRKALEEGLKEQAARLKRSNELKDMFTDIMRHDLLNPIGVIRNYVELIKDEELPPLARKSIEAISKNAAKAVEMIENASRLAKIENLQEIEFEERDLGAMLKEAVEVLKSHGEKKGITLVAEADGEYPAMVNPFLEDVFSNLLSNAIKYSPEKTKVYAGIEDAGKSWRAFVKDQGEGVPDQYKETIFTRFERLKREGVKGTGIGLAIVKKIVEMHRGRVWVEDNPGGGSIFYVEIPKEPAG
ncbi:MAG: PAS domain-containing sensor histidine kinase [Methanobacteriota archaeon]|nr:MAG: PAS domain-containing sensor histidine kinase [Euryarchaeota archaeon]